MPIEQTALPTFANHQTFHPRFGWIKKGFDQAALNPNVFNAPDAPVTLGVGKNMVEAIRFWATATRVVTRVAHPDRPRISVSVPTFFGQALLDERLGLDPFMEDQSTLWILHWQALSAPSILPIWRLAFDEFNAIEFTDEELTAYCIDEIAATTWAQPKPSSVQKDVDCLLRMYSRRETRGRQTIDELLDSPFRELEIIQPSPGKRGSYRFVRGKKSSLPNAAITFACLDFMSRDGTGSRTTSVTRLSVDPGSPGRLFKLTESEISDAIEDSARSIKGIALARPAGSRQLTVDSNPAHVALAVLLEQHSRRRPELLSVENLEVSGPKAVLPTLTDAQITNRIRRASMNELPENPEKGAVT